MHLALVPHPSTPPSGTDLKVWAMVEHSAAFGATATANIWFGVGAPIGRFVIPEADERGRADEIWRTTCFEAFVRETGAEAYREWNFAPSGNWAAYDFTGYRYGMANADLAAPPYIRLEDNLTWWSLGSTFTVEAGPRFDLGLSAVLEEQDGTKSYWALAHPAEKPDFHNPGCFTARLA
jgi:hypothetical protein